MESSLRTKNLDTISPELYQDLVHYFKYASSAYTLVCMRPNGNTLVTPISNPETDIQGFIARDDYRKEIIVSLRGSSGSITDTIMDAFIVLVPIVWPGINMPSGARVHSGFLLGWNSVALEVLPVVEQQLSSHPDYGLVTTGHSLGGAMATLAAVYCEQKFRDYGRRVKTYSYGAPRLGNKIFADYVNETFGEDSYRVVHTNDGVPTMIPIILLPPPRDRILATLATSLRVDDGSV